MLTYRKRASTQDPGLQSNIEHDQLNQTFTRHQGTDAEGFSPYQAIEPSSKCTAQELRTEGDADDPDNVCSCDT